MEKKPFWLRAPVSQAPGFFPLKKSLETQVHNLARKGGAPMKSTAGCTVKRTFLDIPNAAELAGFSVRHFRRIIEEEQIRIVQIGRKFFILGADFERWQATKRVKPS